jgi:hypothetical protein
MAATAAARPLRRRACSGHSGLRARNSTASGSQTSYSRYCHPLSNQNCIQAREKQCSPSQPFLYGTAAHKEEEDGEKVLRRWFQIGNGSNGFVDTQESWWRKELEGGTSPASNFSGEVRLSHRRGKQREDEDDCPERLLFESIHFPPSSTSCCIPLNLAVNSIWRCSGRR